MQNKCTPKNRLYHARAKYVPDGVGGVRLAMVQGFSYPVFNPSPHPERESTPQAFESALDEAEVEIIGAEDDIERASRRAKIAAFDKILCNFDLDTFATFTFAPDAVVDRGGYDECYQALKPWLSNRVQRRGLKYVIVPERHKKGGIHFHALMNSSALSLERAHSAKSGRALNHAGNPLYNLTDWPYGFTSAEIIRHGAEDRQKVAKYIFKYMGKQSGQKIGGRYVLSGGDLIGPTYIYGDSVDELLDGSTVVFDREVEVPGGAMYYEYSTL